MRQSNTKQKTADANGSYAITNIVTTDSGFRILDSVP